MFDTLPYRIESKPTAKGKKTLYTLLAGDVVLDTRETTRTYGATAVLVDTLARVEWTARHFEGQGEFCTMKADEYQRKLNAGNAGKYAEKYPEWIAGYRSSAEYNAEQARRHRADPAACLGTVTASGKWAANFKNLSSATKGLKAMGFQVIMVAV